MKDTSTALKADVLLNTYNLTDSLVLSIILENSIIFFPGIIKL